MSDRDLYRKLLYGLIVRFHLKQNGLRALIDTRQSDDISRSSLVEAANAHTTAITESLLQSWSDHIRLFPCISPKGRVRIGGLRGAGGFVFSGEAVDGKPRWARVKSLLGGKLRVSLPGVALREMETLAGVEYDVLPGAQRADLALAPAPERVEPRVISIDAAESGAGRLLHYPEDLPFGQVIHDSNLYVGIPERYGAPRPLPSLNALLTESAKPGWEDRQEAARLLARLGSKPEVLSSLDRLCADPMNVVAHTAAVSLVHIGTPEAMRIAGRHAAKDAVPGLKREVEKARGRLRRPAN